jgi:uncharacterized protein YlzI (FlbEa/FlbD family)
MIKLTGHKLEEEIYIMPEQMLVVYPQGTGSRIILGDHGIYVVNESPEEVVRKIMEYKLAMARYNAASIASASQEFVDEIEYSNYAERTLKSIAGLEN